MKKYLSGLITGIALTTLVGSLVIGASAISSKMTITVDPINVQVNGEVFAPTDANGREVPVFAYNGTTYAPLRALAEAYGLEVGYDAGSNMATVKDAGATPVTTPATDTAAKTDYSFDYSYEEFVGLWEEGRSTFGPTTRMFISVDDNKTIFWIENAPSNILEECATKFTHDNSETQSVFVLNQGGNAGQIIYTVGQ